MDNEISARFSIAIDDFEMDDDDLRRFMVFIKSNRLFNDWHSPFRGNFIVDSFSSSEKIASSIGEYFDNARRFHVIKINLGNNTGLLPAQTWQWMSRFKAIKD